MIASSGKPVMVLMLSASGSPDDRVSGLTLGADDYLAKPFHFPELVLRIRALARRQPAARSRVFRAAGVELNPCAIPPTATGGSSTSPPGSSQCSKRSYELTMPSSAPKTSSDKPERARDPFTATYSSP